MQGSAAPGRADEGLSSNTRQTERVRTAIIVWRGHLENHGRRFPEHTCSACRGRRELYKHAPHSKVFPTKLIVATLSRQLIWSRFALLLAIEAPLARARYAEMCRARSRSTFASPPRGSRRGRLELEPYPRLTRCREWIRHQAIFSRESRDFALARSMLKGLSRARHHGARLETTMNLKALFLALALSLPFAAAATTVSSVASADPLPAAQARKSAPEAHRIGEGKRGEHAKGQHRRAEHRKGSTARVAGTAGATMRRRPRAARQRAGAPQPGSREALRLRSSHRFLHSCRGARVLSLPVRLGARSLDSPALSRAHRSETSVPVHGFRTMIRDSKSPSCP